MRSTDERMTAVKQRTRELKQKQKVRNGRMMSLSAIAASLALIVGAGIAMPGIMAQINSAAYFNVSGTASIFFTGDATGYVVMALLAFTLGVCVTILCTHLKHSATDTHHHGNKGE